ncbi:MAG TPA: endolytic transglycosylase MltG [Gammaproteobacteria bacterium]|mgnify:CR=1 FL=1|nr:endolytic transglycosylase MltG [Gammaproteobacteria bacterium]
MKWRRLALAALLLAAALAAAGAWIWRDMQRNLDAPIAIARPELFEIAPGSSVTKIAKTFAARGWLRHPLYLRIDATRSGLASRIQAGWYELRPGDTPRGLLARFVAGDVKTYAVTFVEGATVRDLLAQTAALPGLVHELGDTPPAQLLKALGGPDRAAEGWFFPSTYDYRHASSDRELLARAHRQMVKVLEKHWAARDADLPYASPYEALVTASIVEKETARAEERRAIAGVFVRRLQRGMRLQTDPSVIYGLGSAFDGNLRRADLERDTPYNTYLRSGLPPTPICMPGEAAIAAALHPAPGDALYFVARGDGSHVFSATLDAHNAAVHEHQRARKRDTTQ